MIIIVIIFYLILNNIPKWILKANYKKLEKSFSWKIPFLKITPLIFSFLFAFLIVSGVTLSTEKKFIENKNAIHGLKFKNYMHRLGFEDNMKITSINNEKIDKVSDILIKILNENDKSIVSVELNGIKENIVLDHSDRTLLIQNFTTDAIIPIKYDSNGENKIIAYIFTSIFALFSISSLYQLFKIRILKISKNGIIIKKYLLPQKRNLKFEDIKTIKQSEEKIRFYPGVNMFEKGFLLSNYKTIISLKNSEKIELTSLSETNFYEFEKLYFKLKRGEGKIKKTDKKLSMFMYLFENIGTIIFVLFS